MHFRLVIQVVILSAAWVGVAAAAPRTGKKVDDLVAMGRSLLDAPDKPTHHHHHKTKPSEEEEDAPHGGGSAAPDPPPPPPPEPVVVPEITPPAPAPAERKLSAREARIRSGKNYPMQGAIQSPLTRVGVPVAAVPVVATVATLSTMTFWTFLFKSLGVLAKGMIAGHLKKRAKKDKKLDLDQRQFVVFGFRLRPAELLALFLGSVVYGLAVCYTLKGWKLESSFLLRQETLVVAIFFLRSFIRFIYERLFGIVTQFRFWMVGSLLCLGSAYLGNTLATVGYELESAKGKEAAQRVIKMKAWLIFIMLLMAAGLCIANLLQPDRVLQSARLISSGMALAELLPIAPMPGLAIYKWRRSVWAVLLLLVVPGFFLMNFIL